MFLGCAKSPLLSNLTYLFSRGQKNQTKYFFEFPKSHGVFWQWLTWVFPKVELGCFSYTTEVAKCPSPSMYSLIQGRLTHAEVIEILSVNNYCPSIVLSWLRLSRVFLIWSFLWLGDLKVEKVSRQMPRIQSITAASQTSTRCLF